MPTEHMGQLWLGVRRDVWTYIALNRSYLSHYLRLAYCSLVGYYCSTSPEEMMAKSPGVTLIVAVVLCCALASYASAPLLTVMAPRQAHLRAALE
jgi:hypothetical protein